MPKYYHPTPHGYLEIINLLQISKGKKKIEKMNDKEKAWIFLHIRKIRRRFQISKPFLSITKEWLCREDDNIQKKFKKNTKYVKKKNFFFNLQKWVFRYADFKFTNRFCNLPSYPLVTGVTPF